MAFRLRHLVAVALLVACADEPPPASDGGADAATDAGDPLACPGYTIGAPCPDGWTCLDEFPPPGCGAPYALCYMGEVVERYTGPCPDGG